VHHEFQLHQNQLQWLFLLFLQNYESLLVFHHADLLDQIVDNHIKELEKIFEYKQNVDLFKGCVIWFEYFETHKIFFATLFKSTSTFSFRKKLLAFIINDLEKKLDASSAKDKQIDEDIILKFLGMAIVGIMESYVVGELTGDTETVAKQVGQLVKKIFSQ